MRKICFLLLLVVIVALSITSCSKKTTEPDNDLPKAPPPTISPEGGTFTIGQTVTLSCSLTSAEIYYTTNGTDPNSSSLLYTHPISCNTTQTIKAIALHPDYKQSNVVTASFTINMIIPENMAFVSGGTFSPNEGSYMVTLSSYFIGKYEVTQAEWESVMTGNTNGISATPSYFFNNPTHPVESVSWYDILVYCNRKSIQEGLTPCYAKDGDTNPDNWGFVPTQTNTYWNAITMNMSADGYRLPTEMEWEFAARGGNQSQGYNYSGSNVADDVAWYRDFYHPNYDDTTHPVGTKAPNEPGIYDMSGNVWEWCWDWYGSYPTGSYTNPTGSDSGSNRVLRGGGWDSYYYHCHVSHRSYRVGSSYRDNIGGFRILRRIQ